MESATLTRPQPGSRRLARLLAVPPSTWARVGFGLLCAAGVVCFFAYPTFPNYDSYYALLWGRDLVHLHLPALHVYRAPTEHPLAIAFGAVLSVFGAGADRLMIAATIGSFVGLAAGLYQLARTAFTAPVAALAVLLLCTRFDFPFLAARGYLDIPYLALVVWAGALEAERRRRGVVVFLALAAAGLLRPEAWLLSGAYFLWCGWGASWGERARFAALAALAPVVWAGLDLLVTGDPLYSLHSTSGLAEELGRAKGLSAVPGAMAQFLVRLDKLPVLVGALVGLVLAAALTPRRVVMPLVLLVSGIGTFVLVGIAGLSVIDRYLLVAAVMVMVFAGVGLAGWTMLRPGSRLRRGWALLAGALILYAITYTALTVSLDSFQTELSFRGDAHRALAAVLADPRVRADLRCGPLSVPNHKLIPDARWLLRRGPSSVIARSQARVQAERGRPRLRQRITRGVAIYPTGQAVTRQALVDVTDDPLDQVPLAGFTRLVTSQYYSAYGRC